MTDFVILLWFFISLLFSVSKKLKDTVNIIDLSCQRWSPREFSFREDQMSFSKLLSELTPSSFIRDWTVLMLLTFNPISFAVSSFTVTSLPELSLRSNSANALKALIISSSFRLIPPPCSFSISARRASLSSSSLIWNCRFVMTYIDWRSFELERALQAAAPKAWFPVTFFMNGDFIHSGGLPTRAASARPLAAAQRSVAPDIIFISKRCPKTVVKLLWIYSIFGKWLSAFKESPFLFHLHSLGESASNFGWYDVYFLWGFVCFNSD